LLSALALNNVNNTADADKPISTAQSTALTAIMALVSEAMPKSGGTFTGGIAIPSKTTPALNTGTVPASEAQVYLKANIASPTFTGTPAAPTAAIGANTTQVATTAFVNSEIANDAVPKMRTVNGKALSADITLSAADVGAAKITVSTTQPTGAVAGDFWFQG
jgi:hypothetical protein